MAGLMGVDVRAIGTVSRPRPCENDLVRSAVLEQVRVNEP